jgi:hypothetical protein
MKILQGLDKEKFTEAFLKAYLQDGFTAMTKREIDLLVLRLLVDHREGWSWEDPPNAFDMAQALRAKRTRLRSMLDELSFRMFADDDSARKRLKKIIEDRIHKKSEDILDGNRVQIEIEDGFLREFAKDLVQKNYGIVDSSFNSSIIVLSGDKFLALVFEILPDANRDEIESEINKHADFLSNREKKDLLRAFIEQAVKGAGSEAGKQAVKLGMAALTGGASELPGLVTWLIEKMRKDDGARLSQAEVTEV